MFVSDKLLRSMKAPLLISDKVTDLLLCNGRTVMFSASGNLHVPMQNICTYIYMYVQVYVLFVLAD